jgi:uncharacterized protein YdeI (YjbR/CyaY-like superfamily)
LEALVADDPIISFESVPVCVAWFESNHESSPGLWLKIGKAARAGSTVSYEQALDVALRFGWIDGHKKPLDDEFWLQRFTPRRARSRWSRRNRDKAEAMIAAGTMAPAGLREVEKARADGRWDAAYDGPKSATVPPDLRAALDADPEASAFFETLTSTNRFAILYRIGEAKKPETRTARIAKFVEMCHRHETVHPQKG